MARPWTVVGDPTGPRTAALSAALAAAGQPPPRVVSYEQVVAHGAPASADGGVLRLDGPGRRPETWRALISAGRSAALTEGAPIAPEAAAPRSRIVGVRQWYLGLRRVMADLRAHARPAVWTTAPEAVVTLFDKRHTHALLDDAGVSVPPALPSPGSFDELWAALDAARWSRVFIKLRHGSAASGVLAFARGPRGVRAWTTAAARADGLHNSRRLQRLDTVAEVARVVDALAPEGLHVERWIPKAGLDGRTFDLRLLTIAGEPAHAMLRLARGPITNLHLLNGRAPAERLRALMTPSAWEALEATARRVAACFPGCLQLALDVAITPGLEGHAVLEVNAFGDLLKGAIHEGLDSYGAQVAALDGWRARRAA